MLLIQLYLGNCKHWVKLVVHSNVMYDHISNGIFECDTLQTNRSQGGRLNILNNSDTFLINYKLKHKHHCDDKKFLDLVNFT